MTGFDIFDQFATDPSKELDGVWHIVGAALNPEAPEDERKYPRIKVARSANKRHSRIITALWEANKTTLDGKDEAAEVKGEEITIQAMAEGILVNWENLTFKKRKLEDGWNIADAKAMLSVKDFREKVNKHANTFADYRIDLDKVDAGN